MQIRTPVLVGFIFLDAVFALSAVAQTIPMHSGHLSHGAPQMRAQGSGLYYPNRPKYHHHYGHAGYRDVFARAPRPQHAYEALVPF